VPEPCNVHGCPRQAETVLEYRNLGGFVERPMCGEHFMSVLSGQSWFVDDRVDEIPPPIRMAPEAPGHLEAWTLHHFHLGPRGGRNILLEATISGQDEKVRFMLSGIEAELLVKSLMKVVNEAGGLLHNPGRDPAGP
jgi:hypothetical protein